MSSAFAEWGAGQPTSTSELFTHGEVRDARMNEEGLRGADDRLYEVVADLHIHSVLSPCADLEMSPTAIIRRAQEANLSLVALTDHNMAENCLAFHEAAAKANLSVLYGMEVRTQEEVDLLCLFDDLESALALQEMVYSALPDIANDPDLFGDQVVVDIRETVIRMETRLLINAVSIPFQAAVNEAMRRGGLAVPAHIDRPANSLISQLGFPPSGCHFDAAEVSEFTREEQMRTEHPWLREVPLVRFSDAHRLEEIGRQRTVFDVSVPSVGELRRALRREQGRSFR